MIGRLIGHYRIVEKIGAGGMGEIFRARDERLGRDVALKLIRPASGNNPDHLRRFEQEARAAASLNHPNIVAIYDVGSDGDMPYIVSELLEGATLRQRLLQGPIPVREAAGYTMQIVHGLVAAHERKIVHRDLKPENLFVTRDGRVKILDFGVAKLQTAPAEDRAVQDLPTITKSGVMIGTVAYMSPEQLRGKDVDHRSDIFSLGAILYEMLSGHRAFSGETEVDTMTAVLREEPSVKPLESISLPQPYQDVIRHCLEKDPDDRFQSAKDLAFALQTLTGSSTTGEAHALELRRRAKPARAVPWILAGVLALLTVVLAAALLRPSAPPPNYRRVTFEAGTVYSARFGPDGQIVYGAAWNGRPEELFYTVGNSLPQPLNLNHAGLLAVSSKNDLAVVLGGTHTGQLETTGGMLAEAPMGGGSPHELLSDVRWADWDPHGALAVVHQIEGRSRIEYPVGTVLYQTSGWVSHIRFSPQGDRIAFLDHPALWDNKGTVCVLDLSGRVRTLTREWESEHGIAWRPDGKEIWFSAVEKGTNLNLMAVDLEGNARVLLNIPVAITLQDISRNGDVLVTLNSRRLAMAAGTRDEQEDADLSWHDWSIVKDISGDGKFLLFEDSSEAAGPAYSVALRRLDGTLPVRLGEGSAGGLSPDGKWAIAIGTAKSPQVTLLPIGPGQPRSIDTTGLEHISHGWARFLADGRRVTVDGNEAGHAMRCYVLDLSGTKAKAITPEGTLCGPSSPDDRLVVGIHPDSPVTLYSLDGGAPQLIPHLTPLFHPVQWSADGVKLFGYRNGELPSKIYEVEIATGKETLVKELRPGVPAGVVMIAPIVVSRDGRRVAYSYSQTLSALYTISGLR